MIIAAVLKTAEGDEPSVGSNPTPASTCLHRLNMEYQEAKKPPYTGSSPVVSAIFGRILSLLFLLPVGVMAAQGSLKPLVFDRNEYRQLCYMSSLKWQLTILDERDIARKGQCVINPAGTAVRWRSVQFKIKGLTKVNSFLYLTYIF